MKTPLPTFISPSASVPAHNIKRTNFPHQFPSDKLSILTHKNFAIRNKPWDKSINIASGQGTAKAGNDLYGGMLFHNHGEALIPPGWKRLLEFSHLGMY